MKTRRYLIAGVMLTGIMIAVPDLCLAQFALLDKHSDENKVGLEFGFSIPTHEFDSDDDPFMLRTELQARRQPSCANLFNAAPVRRYKIHSFMGLAFKLS